MDKGLEQEVCRRARWRCEYCHLPQSASQLRFPVDHIIAIQHGGQTELDNLALCCPRCNRQKGPNIASVDPDTGKLTQLFHPRRDRWTEHFRYEGALLTAQTAIGRCTIRVLAINDPLRVSARQALIDEGVLMA